LRLREVGFAAALLAAGAAATYGASLLSVPIGWVTGGVLFGMWSWLVLAE
jgi:hypothetical protein